mgnify:CR=1 FL=1
MHSTTRTTQVVALLVVALLDRPSASSARAGFGGLVLPPVVYGTEGVEGNIYFDNISPSKSRDFEFEISMTSKSASLANESYHDMGDFVAGSVKQQVERLVYRPTANSLADVVVQVTDRDTNNIVAKNYTTLVTTNSSAGKGKTASIVVIGDSLTASGEHTAWMMKNAANDSMKLKLIGSRGQSLTNRHEGRGGWTVQDYATYGRPGVFFHVTGIKSPPGGDPKTSAPESEGWVIPGDETGHWVFWGSNLTQDAAGLYTGLIIGSCYPCPAAALKPPQVGKLVQSKTNTTIPYRNWRPGSLNPFWSGSKEDGKLDVAAYLRNNNLEIPDAATIMLGDNDLSSASTDEIAQTEIASMTSHLRTLIIALLDAGVASVGIVLQPPPSSQDGFGEDYGVMINSGKPNWTQHGVSNAWREKRAMLHWWEAQIRLVRSIMVELHADEWQHRTGSPVAIHDDRQGYRRKDPLLLLGVGAAGKSVTVVPAGLNLDTVHNMDIVKVPANARSSATDPAQQIERSVNGVHPAESGQAQIADALWSWLKFRMSVVR